MNITFLKNKREFANKTQLEIANELGITTQSYFKIEKGINNLHPRHWGKLQQILGITEKELQEFSDVVSITNHKKKMQHK